MVNVKRYYPAHQEYGHGKRAGNALFLESIVAVSFRFCFPVTTLTTVTTIIYKLLRYKALGL
jgi:hypothetical protein